MTSRDYSSVLTKGGVMTKTVWERANKIAQERKKYQDTQLRLKEERDEENYWKSKDFYKAILQDLLSFQTAGWKVESTPARHFIDLTKVIGNENVRVRVEIKFGHSFMYTEVHWFLWDKPKDKNRTTSLNCSKGPEKFADGFAPWIADYLNT
jgi:hypothetical protein